MSQSPMVRNASSEKQVKSAEKKLEVKRLNELEDLRWVLSDPRGRRVLWRILDFCSVFRSIWEASAKIHYNAGRQDVGHFVQSEVTEARPNAMLEMILEHKTKELKDGQTD